MKIIKTLQNNTYQAICGCGNTCEVTKGYLDYTRLAKKEPVCKSCQSKRKSDLGNSKFDFSKYYLKKYGRLTITSTYLDQTRNDNKKRSFICICDCGSQFTTTKSSLIRGSTISCGCHRWKNAQKMGKSTMTHGHTNRNGMIHFKSPTYKQWDKIINCCRKGWKRQAHKVCHEYDKNWESFENFLNDFGSLKLNQKVIRIDKQMPWSKENCFIHEVF